MKTIGVCVLVNRQQQQQQPKKQKKQKKKTQKTKQKIEKKDVLTKCSDLNIL